ncbi:hypothetical protein L798_11488 [Zootermopsis nevadensis]|uniref:Peptidase A2 domain-containing protein n=1 Tax=Zootermopsis nevadensis TaxID=136037 RepID=A0A067R8V5_ZOONE|nr:hypothetical protein L798_11488 [Zootermopsis nevadensis]
MVKPEEIHDILKYISENPLRESEVMIFYINEDNLHGCPQAKLKIGDKELIAILDSGAEMSIISETLVDALIESGLKLLRIPVVNGVLISAWGSRTKMIRKQALIPIKIDDQMYEQVFMVAPQLLAHAILEANILNDFQVVVDFKEKCFSTKQDGKRSRHSFIYKDTSGGGDGNRPIASSDLATSDHRLINGIKPGRSES